MSQTPEPAAEPTFEQLRAMWEAHDPAPAGLAERMRAVVAQEVALADAELEYELMLLLERTSDLAGTRGGSTGTAYTLRFGNDHVDLLVRASREGESSRLDGWVVPPGPGVARVTEVGGREQVHEAEVDEHGRFELRDLPSGLYRIWLEPRQDLDQPDARPFATPAFEI